MFAQNLATQNIPVLHLYDEVQKALDLMRDFHVLHLPIIDDNQHYIGLVSEKKLLDLPDEQESLDSYQLVYSRPFVYEHQHTYEALRVFHEEKLSLLPVIDTNGEWIGSIDWINLLNYCALSNNVNQPGGILVFELNYRDYSLSEIAHIVKSEDAIILNSSISTSPIDPTILQVTLKLNKQDLKHIIATFERFNYNIIAVFQEVSYRDNLTNRYDSLMSYLNI